ncbi:MAG TPA: 5'-nucleotidase, lipoprotein e(P4) family [Chryseosolibacter sp.]
MLRALVFACFSFFSIQTFAQTSPAPHSNKTLSVIWQQQSAEYRALCYQAFNLAQLRLDNKKIKKRHKYAIITDIDETVLDNSYYEADNIRNGTEFAKDTWNQWTSKSKATPVPGALEFLQHAKRKGVSIFYISNRDTTEVNSTVRNLAQYNFPDADRAHMIFMSGTSSKEERRLQVMKEYRVIMLLGDNLNDFTQLFEKKSNQERLLETDKVRAEWGQKFIVLPNATYGEWENAAYGYQRNLTPEQKNQKLVEKLKGSEQK